MPDPDLTPEEQEVRRLLADARHDEPLPDDVAARLDGVLADLGAETSSAPDVDLAARQRRRRTARNVLIAAAAVVVIGVGISRVDLDTVGDADSGSSSAESSLDDDAGGDTAAPVAPARGPVLRLRSEDFDQQLDRLGADQGYAALTQRAEAELDAGATTLSDLAARPGWCDDPAWGRGLRLAVRYDGERAVLVLRQASGGSRDADLYLCGETTPTRSTTVPAR